MRATLDDKALLLVAETNDQRRCVGKTLHYLHRTLLLWRDRGRDFSASVRAFSPGAAAMFASLESRLLRLPEAGRDLRLRRWLAPIFDRLADDLDRGERMLVPFVRWLEGRFPELTKMMSSEASSSKIHDAALARDLALAFGAAGRADRAHLAEAFRDASKALFA